MSTSDGASSPNPGKKRKSAEEYPTKSTDMICALSTQMDDEVAIRHQLKRSKESHAKLLQEPRTLWTSKLVVPVLPRPTKEEVSSMPLNAESPFTEDKKWRHPPSSVALSDELVYWATKFVAAKDRTIFWPVDFNVTGDVRPGRLNQNPAMVSFAHGLPTAPVYKGYYVLWGHDAAITFGSQLSGMGHRDNLKLTAEWC